MVTQPVFLIGHNDPGVIEIAQGFAARNGLMARVEPDGRHFPARADPVRIFYGTFRRYWAGTVAHRPAERGKGRHDHRQQP